MEIAHDHYKDNNGIYKHIHILILHLDPLLNIILKSGASLLIDLIDWLIDWLKTYNNIVIDMVALNW